MSEPTNANKDQRMDGQMTWLIQAALSGQADAQDKLGSHLLEMHNKLGGTETTILELLARELFRKAAEQKHEGAAKHLQTLQNKH